MSTFFVYPRENGVINAQVSDGYLVSATTPGDALYQASEDLGITGDWWVVGIGERRDKFNVSEKTLEISTTETDDSNPFSDWPTDYVGPAQVKVKGVKWTAAKKPFLYFIYARGITDDSPVTEGYLLWEFSFDKAIERGVPMFGLIGDYWIGKAVSYPHKGNIPEAGSKIVLNKNAWVEDL